MLVTTGPLSVIALLFLSCVLGFPRSKSISLPLSVPLPISLAFQTFITSPSAAGQLLGSPDRSSQASGLFHRKMLELAQHSGVLTVLQTAWVWFQQLLTLFLPSP